MEPLARAKVDPDGAIDENCRQRQPMVGKALFCQSRAPRRCGQNDYILTRRLIDGSYVLRGWHKVWTPQRAVKIGGQQSDHGFSMSKYLSAGRNSGVPQYIAGTATIANVARTDSLLAEMILDDDGGAERLRFRPPDGALEALQHGDLAAVDVRVHGGHAARTDLCPATHLSPSASCRPSGRAARR